MPLIQDQLISDAAKAKKRPDWPGFFFIHSFNLADWRKCLGHPMSFVLFELYGVGA